MDGPSTHMAGMSPLLGSSLQTKATGTEGWDGRPSEQPRASRGRCRPQLQAPRSENTLGPSPRRQGSTVWGSERPTPASLAGKPRTQALGAPVGLRGLLGRA